MPGFVHSSADRTGGLVARRVVTVKFPPRIPIRRLNSKNQMTHPLTHTIFAAGVLPLAGMRGYMRCRAATPLPHGRQHRPKRLKRNERATPLYSSDGTDAKWSKIGPLFPFLRTQRVAFFAWLPAWMSSSIWARFVVDTRLSFITPQKPIVSHRATRRSCCSVILQMDQPCPTL